MTNQDAKDLSKYVDNNNYVVVYSFKHEDYEVTSIDDKWTELANWEPWQLTKDIDANSIVVYRVVHNWRTEV